MSATLEVPTPAAAGNATSVSATLVDFAGNVWANATITATFVPPPNGNGPYYWGTQTPFPMVYKWSSNLGGAFAEAIPDNLTITPPGSMWQFIVTPTATMPSVIFTMMIAGSAMDISSIFTSQSHQLANTVVQSLPVPLAYSDAEMTVTPNMGQMYYNTLTNQLRVWTGVNYSNSTAGWTGVLGTADVNLPNNYDLNNLSGNGVYLGGPLVNAPAGIPQSGISVVQLGSIRLCHSSADTTNAIYIASFNGTAWNPWTVLIHA